jgi:RNA polymerase sigma-70 factor (ECF subfamily)
MLDGPRHLSDLLVRVARQDRVAFAEVYRATSAKLYGIILRICRRRELADEMLQEVYIKVWERSGDFDPARASPITWLATIARNRALDEVRRKQPVALDDAPEVLEIQDDARLASEWVEIAGEVKRLDACLQQLEERRRDIIRLAYIDGLSREELSRRYGAPVATIKTWLHRGLKQLKDCLDP